MESAPLIFLTGGTGYIGGRLIPQLEQRSVRLRCGAREPQRLRHRVNDATEILKCDVLDPETLKSALAGVHTAFYLVHSMGTAHDFEDDDRRGARNFALAARNAGVKRIIYLGGLGNPSQSLSKHLRSRQEVGAILRESGAQVIELRASIIIGSGSLSFELVRSLVEKLPMMIWPRWVSTEASPIAVEDVLAYLLAALDQRVADNRVYEIGGPDRVSYGDIMRDYARQRGLRRLTVRAPFISPRLSSLWLGLVTPVYARIGRKLVESLRNPTVVTDNTALTAFDIRPRGLSEAIRRALNNEDRKFAATRWSDALSSAGRPRGYGGIRFGNRLVDSRTVTVDVPVHEAFQPIRHIGGRTGWYYMNWLWKVRGFLDLLVGGVGLRRGRTDQITVGDTIDCWRVEKFDAPRHVRLAAEMKLPGRAWLEFEITAESPTQSTIRQTAIFDPIGLFGLAYWYAVWPLHQFVFAGMLAGIARAAADPAAPSKGLIESASPHGQMRPSVTDEVHRPLETSSVCGQQGREQSFHGFDELTND